MAPMQDNHEERFILEHKEGEEMTREYFKTLEHLVTWARLHIPLRDWKEFTVIEWEDSEYENSSNLEILIDLYKGEQSIWDM